jgi:hypothetical protein
MSDGIVAGKSGDTRVVIGNWCTEMKCSLHILTAVLYWSLFNKTLFVIKQYRIWVHSVFSMHYKYVPSDSITNNGQYWQKKLNCLEKVLSQYLFTHHKFHMDWPGIEPGSLLWEAGDWLICLKCI